MYPFAPAAFAKYLSREGIKPEILAVVPRLVELAIEEGDRATHWPELRRAIGAARWEWADPELFLTGIASSGGAKILCEASQLGFVDHRFEHAIITLQRFVRYRRAHPLGPGGGPRGKVATLVGEAAAARLADFEREHHKPDPAWRGHLIHLRSFGEVERRLTGRGEDAETSVVRWNKKCVPEYLASFLRCGGEFSEYEMSYGVATFITGESTDRQKPDFNPTHAVQGMRERLYRANKELLLSDDALAKTAALIRIYTEGGLTKTRSPRRDVLKFLDFTLNETPPKWVETAGKFSRDTPIAKCYLDRLDNLPPRVLEAVFRALPGCLATHGRALTLEFSRVALGDLDSQGVRRWFSDMIIDEIGDVCRGTDADPKAFRMFLKGRALEKAALDPVIRVARDWLSKCQRVVLSGEPLYNCRVWSEPIKVAAVTLPPQRP